MFLCFLLLHAKIYEQYNNNELSKLSQIEREEYKKNRVKKLRGKKSQRIDKTKNESDKSV